MVGAHSAAEGEALIDGIIPNKEVILGCFSRMVAIGIQSKASQHVLHIVKGQLALLAIEFIGSYNRSTGEAVATLAYIHFLECSIRFLHLFLWSYAHVESLSESLFNSCEVLFLVGCELLCQWNVILVLLPLPHTAPMPEIAIGQRVVAGHLKVGSGAVVYLLDWKREAVEIYPTLALGSNDAIARNFMVLLVALHVFEANPAGTPSGRIKTEGKPVRYVATRSVEFESQRILLWTLVVYPQHYAIIVLQGKGLLYGYVNHAAWREIPFQTLGAFLIIIGRKSQFLRLRAFEVLRNLVLKPDELG